MAAKVAHAAPASICIVNSDCHPTLQAAINAASAGDTIEIGVGEVTEAGVVITKNLTIQGKSASQSIVQAATLDRTANDRVFLVNGGVTATLRDLTIRHGYVNGQGGGILNNGTLTLLRSTVRDNATQDAAGITCINANICLGNKGNDGGGIYNNGLLTVIQSTINDNSTGKGGDITLNSPCTLACTARDGGFGGGIHNNNNRTLVMSNSTLSGNRTGAGGVCNGSNCSSGKAGLGGGLQASVQFAQLNNVTITDNQGRGGGGINHTTGVSNSIVTLKNGLVVGNRNENGSPSDCSSDGIVSQGYNLVGSGTGCPSDGTGDLTTANPATALDPILADNGGPTFTHALVAGSPAINAGNPAAPGSDDTACELKDQRGFTRPDRCDIGAFELNGINDIPNVTINQAAAQADPASTSPVLFTATFSEPVSDFASGDVSLAGTANLSGAIVNISGGPSVYTISVDGITGNGTVVASIAANVATDATGNGNTASTSTDNSVTVNFDTTPPVITPTVSGTLGSNGWYTSDVTVSWSVVDNESAVTSQVNCDSTSLSTDTVGTTYTCKATSAGGTAEKSVTVKRDATPPTAALAVSAGTLGQNGWYVSDVSIQTSGTDALSGIASCTAPQALTTDSTGSLFTGSCTDQAGNSTNGASITVKRDATAPTAILAVSAGTLGLNGWYVSDLTVQTSGTDAQSGIANCTADQSLAIDSAGKAFNGSCTDQAGNTANADPLTVKLDKTAPTLAPTVSPNPVFLNGLATANANAADALSGLASQGCSTPNTGTVGSQSVVCTATDNAGNTNTASVSYQVIPDFPRTATLDTFNRANGSLGANWDGFNNATFYKIAGNRLDVQLGGSIVWKPTVFGVNQEAFVTLSTIDTRSNSQGLLLKVQAGAIPDSGAISVVYDAKVKAVRVSALRLGRNGAWTLYPNQAATFANGDILGARAGANGTVKIYKNGTLIATVTLNAADQGFFNSKGGKIGVLTLNAINALFDDFGGGNLVP